MSWYEAYLTMQGICQRDAALRRGFYLIHRSLVEKPIDILEEWPLPFDEDPMEETRRRVEVLRSQYEIIKKQLSNKKDAAARA